VPQRVVPNVLGGHKDRLGVRGAQCESRAVGKLDELCEGVGPLRSAQECRVAHLLGVTSVGCGRGAKGTQSAGRGYRGSHCVWGVMIAASKTGRVNMAMRSSGVLSATFFERVGRKELPGTSSPASTAATRLLRTYCALLEDESCRRCLVETLTEWRSLSALPRASSRPSIDGAAIHVRLVRPSLPLQLLRPDRRAASMRHPLTMPSFVEATCDHCEPTSLSCHSPAAEQGPVHP
jgi:hypothetical protein